MLNYNYTTAQLQQLHQLITLQYTFKTKRKENISVLKKLKKEEGKKKNTQEKSEKKKYTAFPEKKMQKFSQTYAIEIFFIECDFCVISTKHFQPERVPRYISD